MAPVPPPFWPPVGVQSLAAGGDGTVGPLHVLCRAGRDAGANGLLSSPFPIETVSSWGLAGSAAQVRFVRIRVKARGGAADTCREPWFRWCLPCSHDPARCAESTARLPFTKKKKEKKEKKRKKKKKKKKKEKKRKEKKNKNLDLR